MLNNLKVAFELVTVVVLLGDKSREHQWKKP